MKSSKREVLVGRSVHCGDEHCLHCKWLNNGKCTLFVTKTGRPQRLACDSRFRTLRLGACEEAEAAELARAVTSISDAVIVRVLQPRERSPELVDAEERLRGGPGALESKHAEVIATELDQLRGEVARLSRTSVKAEDEP